MAQINERWGKCIRELLARHQLTYRGAAAKTGLKVSHTTINSWAGGFAPEPSNPYKAWQFLEVFPREEALSCLEAAGLPIPGEWQDQLVLADQVREEVAEYLVEKKGMLPAEVETMWDELWKE